MKPRPSRGTWGIRQLIRLFTVVLAVLFFWLLGFVVEDIESIRGPDYAQFERQHVDAALLAKKERLEKQIHGLERTIDNQREQQRLAGDSSQNLRSTIGQLLELQRLSIQKTVTISESDKSNLSTSLKRFFESQENYQKLNQRIAELTSEKAPLQEEQSRIERQISEQQEAARQAFAEVVEKHQMRLALYQLLILVPVLLAAAYLVARMRGSAYFPLFLAVGGATLAKVALVVHEYFPSRYAKYVLMVALLAIVARLLVHLIRILVAPKPEWIQRQRRECYERFLCPVCEYPIRTGPRRFLYWTRRTVHKILPQGVAPAEDSPYTCPCCGTTVLETCPACGKIRHALLGHCEHCGARKDA
jgi:hypothetical protein